MSLYVVPNHLFHDRYCKQSDLEVSNIEKFRTSLELVSNVEKFRTSPELVSGARTYVKPTGGRFVLWLTCRGVDMIGVYMLSLAVQDHYSGA